MNIVDNYFDKTLVDKLTSSILHFEFPWYYQETVAFGSNSSQTEENHLDNFYHTHMVYDRFRPNSEIFEQFIPFLQKLNVNSLIRIKINKYPKTNKIYTHAKHIDYDFVHSGCVLYLNSCDGYTQVKNKKVSSVENRVLLFDPSTEHTTTTCTDARFRLTVNFNFY
jgi:hypothetical protein